MSNELDLATWIVKLLTRHMLAARASVRRDPTRDTAIAITKLVKGVFTGRGTATAWSAFRKKPLDEPAQRLVIAKLATAIGADPKLGAEMARLMEEARPHTGQRAKPPGRASGSGIASKNVGGLIVNKDAASGRASVSLDIGKGRTGRGAATRASDIRRPLATAPDVGARTSDIRFPLAAASDAGDKPTSVPPDGLRSTPTRTAYALLDCPDAVVVEDEFELVVGLAKHPFRGVIGGGMTIPADSTSITVQVFHDGFRLREGESTRQVLSASAVDLYPKFTLHLRGIRDAALGAKRFVQATFAIADQVVGAAVREIDVAADVASLPEPRPRMLFDGASVGVPTGERAPDLTITIGKGAAASGGGLNWRLETPWKHATIPRDAAVLHTELDDPPEVFAKALIRQVNVREGQPGLYQYLAGAGTQIAELVPTVVFAALRDVAARVRASGRTDAPTVLLISQEPYVPWELAVLKPPLDPTLPPFLGVQTTIGRWVLGHGSPAMPPPAQVNMHAMAVVKGVYSNVPGWKRLTEAEAEADDLVTAYAASAVDAKMTPVLACLEDDTPPADVLHFAVHGSFDPNGVQNGLVLTDSQMLDPLVVRSMTLTRAPFVFLNACQVGMGQAILGDYAGMAAAFLHAGASAVVAPLWSVKDTVARGIAESFYAKTLKGTSAAEVLRAERANFTKSPVQVSATHLAYQFFGHPHFALTR